jgi:origin recognition complex subunit 3
VLVFGVVTSVELFEGRLSRSTVNALKGQRFDVPDSGHSVDELLAALQNQEKGGLWLGHGLSQMIAQISGDRFQSPEYIKGCVKYAYMSHFFANPLSVLLADEVPVKVLHQPRLCEAIRNLPSFRRSVSSVPSIVLWLLLTVSNQLCGQFIRRGRHRLGSETSG